MVKRFVIFVPTYYVSYVARRYFKAFITSTDQNTDDNIITGYNWCCSNTLSSKSKI